MSQDLLWVFSVIRNEETILPYYLRWYSSVAEKIILFDGGSTDKTIEIARSCPKVELRPWKLGDELDDLHFVDHANHQYKEARGKARWVMWPDADEFIYHWNLRELLNFYTRMGVALPGIEGYQMIDDKLPDGLDQIFNQLPYGVRDEVYSKPICFNPAIDVKWCPGKHGGEFSGKVVRPEEVCGLPPKELKLLHYRFIQREYAEARKKNNYSRASQRNREVKYGYKDFPEYTSGIYSMEWYDQAMKERWNVIHDVNPNERLA